jgi:peptide/nickel transport system substrate-binding protein
MATISSASAGVRGRDSRAAGRRRRPGFSAGSGLDRRALVQLLGAGAGLAVLAACGGEESTNAPAPAAAVGQPKPGGTLRFGMLSDLTSLEPHVFITDHTDTIWQVWERLTEYSADLKPQPRLAKSWEINSDASEFVLHLREGVEWHSGRDFTSEDVRYNLLRVRDASTGFALLKTMSDWYETIETPDPHTVVLRSSKPRPATFDFFESFNLGDRESLEAKKSGVAVGTGPFMLGEWRPGDKFNLRKNPNYWDTGKPLLDEQVYSVSLDPQTMLAQFESGALDVAKTPPIRDFVRFRQDKSYQPLVHGSSGAYYAVGFNTSRPPLDDKRVRQALQWTIDRERFAKVILQGTVQPYSLPWPKDSLAYEEGKATFYTYDLDKAKSLLEAAGVRNLEFGMLLNPNTPELIEFAEAYQADVAKLGFKMNIEVVEVAVFVERINARPPNYNGMWASTSSRSNLGSPITMITSGSVLWATNGVNNTAYKSDRYTTVVDALVVESDPARQKQLYSELNDIILEDSWIAMLAPKPPRVALRSNVKGVRHFPALEGFDYRDAWLG